jgi:hypothetical protein
VGASRQVGKSSPFEDAARRMSYGRLLAGGSRKWDEEVTRRLSSLGLSEEGAGLLAPG